MPTTNQYNFSDVFISYAREDSAFVQWLESALTAQGYAVWVDWKDIPKTVNWWEEIQAGIEAANALIFVISAHSAQSEICHREVAHAAANGKRIIPVVCRPVDDTVIDALHPAVQAHNWLDLSQKDSSSVDALITAYRMDEEHLQQHTRYLVRAREWQRREEDASFLMRGLDAQEAQRWLQRSDEATKKPAPLTVQRRYIIASMEQYAQDRQREQQQASLELIDRRVWTSLLGGWLAMGWYMWAAGMSAEPFFSRVLGVLGHGFIFGIIYAMIPLFADELIRIRFPQSEAKRFGFSLLYGNVLGVALWFSLQVATTTAGFHSLPLTVFAAQMLAIGFVLSATVSLRGWQSVSITGIVTSLPFIVLYFVGSDLSALDLRTFFPVNAPYQYLTVGIPVAWLLALGGFFPALRDDWQTGRAARLTENP